LKSFEPKEFNLTLPPNPQWLGGINSLEQPEEAKTTIDPYCDGRTPVDNYRLLVSAVVPRPIALVSTVSSQGNRNLAPFSYFNLVNSDPPIFVIGLSQGSQGPKDTLRNILETKECTVNIVSEWFAEAANQTCVNAPSDQDEWNIAGLTIEPSQRVKAPIVQESAFSIECKLLHHHDWFSKKVEGKHTGTMVILEGLLFHARSEVLNDEQNGLDIDKLKPVSRLGGVTYGRTTEGYNLPRVMWEK
jgi:flavin reductase (DIM6/NTAB) family NADH-FMN oxidoreductase RutF